MSQSWMALTDYLVLIYSACRQGVPAAPHLHIKVDMVHYFLVSSPQQEMQVLGFES